MLSDTEKLIFILIAIGFGMIAQAGFFYIFMLVWRGRPAGSYDRKTLPLKALNTLLDIGLQRPIFKTRPLLSTFHAFIFFGFSFYLLVNINDLAEGFIDGYTLADRSDFPAGLFNIFADVLSVGVLVGMVAFLLRRLRGADRSLYFNENVYLDPKVQKGGIRRDSYIVGSFMLLHVGSRFFGQALHLAEKEITNPTQPFASLVSVPLRELSHSTLDTGMHVTWWIAIGLIVVFLPYFVISKHFHLMIAPLNLILARQEPKGMLDPAAPSNGSSGGAAVEPGAKTIYDLPWTRILDSYACIMCNRCQDVCPAHETGSSLSPSALEINKRYYLNQNFSQLAEGSAAPASLLDTVIPAEAVWSCTTCYACVEICPVGNAPMLDIVDIRRRMILDAPGDMDSGIQSTLETIAKTGNSFGQSARKRVAWTKDLDINIKDISSEPAEYLWFVGDYASFDPRVTPRTQLVARILSDGGVDFGILGKAEKNAGNDVRRVGEEGLFEMLVEDNLAAMGETEFQKIMTTDPHTLNTLRHEYPQFGGMWQVEHYSSMLLRLIDKGSIALTRKLTHYTATYHDPCYLGRYNGGFDAPRQLLGRLGVNLIEMPRNRENSFCCGAGGGQIWKGAAPSGERPAENRIREALNVVGSNGSTPLFVVSCPKDIVMYTDAVKSSGNEGKIEVKDIVELVAEAMGMRVAEPA